MYKTSNKEKNLAFTILVGGKSSRFGSDKGLFHFQGKPLISYQLEALRQFEYDIFIVARSISQVQHYVNLIDINNVTAFLIDEINDPAEENLQIPLIGLYSSFKELNDLGFKKTLVLSCDIPLINKKVVNYLIDCSKKFECCIPQWDNGFLEPLCTIYPIQKALITSKKNLKTKDYKLANLINPSWDTNFISIERCFQPIDKKLLSFININTLEDIDKLK